MFDDILANNRPLRIAICILGILTMSGILPAFLCGMLMQALGVA